MDTKASKLIENINEAAKEGKDRWYGYLVPVKMDHGIPDTKDNNTVLVGKFNSRKEAQQAVTAKAKSIGGVINHKNKKEMTHFGVVIDSIGSMWHGKSTGPEGYIFGDNGNWTGDQYAWMGNPGKKAFEKDSGIKFI